MVKKIKTTNYIILLLTFLISCTNKNEEKGIVKKDSEKFIQAKIIGVYIDNKNELSITEGCKTNIYLKYELINYYDNTIKIKSTSISDNGKKQIRISNLVSYSNWLYSTEDTSYFGKESLEFELKPNQSKEIVFINNYLGCDKSIEEYKNVYEEHNRNKDLEIVIKDYEVKNNGINPLKFYFMKGKKWEEFEQD